MSTINIRQAVLSDIDAIVPLFSAYREFYGRAADLAGARNFLLQRFNHGESVLFIAEAAGVAVAFTQLYPSFSSVSLARTFLLNDLYVQPQYRRKGVASKLLAAAVEYCRALGAVRLTLSTATGNESAQALYASAGWKRDDKFYVYHLVVQP